MIFSLRLKLTATLTYRASIAGRHFAELYYMLFGKVDVFDVSMKGASNEIFHRRISAISLAELDSDRVDDSNANEYKPLKPGVAYLKIISFTDSPGFQFKNWIKKSL